MIEFLEIVKNALLVKVEDIGSFLSSAVNQNLKTLFLALAVLLLGTSLLSSNVVIFITSGIYLFFLESTIDQDLLITIFSTSGALFLLGLLVFYKALSLFKIQPDKNLAKAVHTFFDRMDQSITTIKNIEAEQKRRKELDLRISKMEDILIELSKREVDKEKNESSD